MRAADTQVSRDAAHYQPGAYHDKRRTAKTCFADDTAAAPVLLYAAPDLEDRILRAMSPGDSAQVERGRRTTYLPTWNDAIGANDGLMVLPGRKIQNATVAQEISFDRQDQDSLVSHPHLLRPGSARRSPRVKQVQAWSTSRRIVIVDGRRLARLGMLRAGRSGAHRLFGHDGGAAGCYLTGGAPAPFRAAYASAHAPWVFGPVAEPAVTFPSPTMHCACEGAGAALHFGTDSRIALPARGGRRVRL